MTDFITPAPGPSYPPINPPQFQMPQPPPPTGDQSTAVLSFPSSEAVVANCANSSSPICYNTNISGANLITNLWFSAVLGALCYIGFVFFRSKFRFYQARLDMHEVSNKPPLLKLRGFYRIWSWLIPVFNVSDEELLLSSGMDALIAVRILSFGILLFLPITIAAMGILIPINYLDNFYEEQGQLSGMNDSYTTVFVRLTMSNITPKSPLLWVHFFFVYAAVFWTCWLITEHYKEYITLRQAYAVRSTELPNTDLGGSTGSFSRDSRPLLATRSPMKKKHVLAVRTSPSKVTGARYESRKLRGMITLPRRDASGGSSVGGPEAAINGTSDSTYGNIQHQQQQQQQQQHPSRLSVATTASVPSVPGYRQQQEHDWTLHDFSKDILPTDTAILQPTATAHDLPGHVPVNATTASTAGAAPSILRYPLKRTPSNAAVAAALDLGRATSAAEAVVMIRHHRAASGTSNKSGQTTGSTTPRGAGNAEDDGNPSHFAKNPQQDSLLVKKESNTRLQELNGVMDVAVMTSQLPSQISSASFSKQLLDGNGANGGSGIAGTAAARTTNRGPPGLPSIVRAVQQFADEQREKGDYSSGELPTIVATASEYMNPNGQEGVSSRWWNALSALGNRMMMIDRKLSSRRTPAHSLSITARGAIPFMHLDSNRYLAANASLYTVLVTDQPIERLRLKKPLGNMEFWHSTPTTNMFGLISTHTDEMAAPEALTPVIGDRESNPSGQFQLSSYRGTTEEDQAAHRPSPFAGPRAPENPSSAQQQYDVEHGVIVDTTTTPSTTAVASSSIVIANGEASDASNTYRNDAHDSGNRDLFQSRSTCPNVPEKLIDPGDRQSTIFGEGNHAERGMGLSSGWNATITGLYQWWEHRGRYKEWRRDVRWAMFNRRVRIATDMFTELFGDDFDTIIPIYPTQSVDALIHQWDKASSQLERLQLKLKELAAKDQSSANAHDVSGDKHRPDQKHRSVERSKQIQEVKEHIKQLGCKVSSLQEKISQERDSVLSDLPSTCFFATFKSQKAAAIAAQANLNPINQRLFNVEAAPSPDDVNWPALTRSWWQRQSRPMWVLPLILFIMLLPIGAFTGGFAQITIAVCGMGAADAPALDSDSWYCSNDAWAKFLRNLMTSLAPSILLSLYHQIVLPVLVYYAAQAEGQCYSLSKLDRRCADLFFYWDVFNVFLGAMLGGSILSELPTYLNDPQEIWGILSAAIPASSNFFINYVSYRALVMAWFRLFYPHQAVMTCILKWLHILPWAKTSRDKAVEAPVRNCRYGRDIGIPVLINFVMVMAYAVVSPLILPFGLLYFMLLWAVWRYQMLYVYQRQYESGGQFWPFVAHKVVGCALICVVFTSVVLIFKEAYAQAIILLVTLPLYLLRFDMYLSNRYDAVVAQVPLMAVHKAGRVESVDPNLWTPAPLRPGATGWNPQWGRVWHWWGVPMYTL